MNEEEIAWYVATGEPRDKAGAYGVQGLGARFIEEIHGSFTNVMGLPARAVYRLLRDAPDPALSLARSFFRLSFISYIRASASASVLGNSALGRCVAHPTESVGCRRSAPGMLREAAGCQLLGLLRGRAPRRPASAGPGTRRRPSGRRGPTRGRRRSGSSPRTAARSSPIACPRTSLISLKRSTSISSTESARPVPARARELAADHVVEVVAVVEARQAIADPHLLDLGIRLDQALHLLLQLGLAGLEEQDDDPDADRHLEEHLHEVGVAVGAAASRRGRGIAGTRAPGDALDRPQEEGRRQDRPPAHRARRQREGQRRDQVGDRPQECGRRFRERPSSRTTTRLPGSAGPRAAPRAGTRPPDGGSATPLAAGRTRGPGARAPGPRSAIFRHASAWVTASMAIEARKKPHEAIQSRNAGRRNFW